MINIFKNVKPVALSTQSPLLNSIRAASKKTGGSSKNQYTKCRPKHLGWKRLEGAHVEAGTLLVLQRHLRFHPGYNVGFGRNGTLFAEIPGKVLVSCEKVDLNWDHTWVARCHANRKGVNFYKKYFHVIPEPQHRNFKLIEEI